MKRAILFGMVLSLAAPAATVAQNSTGLNSLRHYRFLPRASTLTESGGIAGRSTDFRVMGTFDVAITPGITDVWPPQFEAKFVNVNAWASHPILAYVLDLDRTLNMEGLRGHQLPVAAPFDVYQFEGKKDDGSKVNLYASLIGPWFYLRGGTTPPPGSADYFSYNIKAVARQRPWADVDNNDVVDAADRTKMMARFGLSASMGASSTMGDTDGDFDVDGGDFLAWQSQAGEEPPSIASLDAMVDAAIASSAAAVSAPEPGAGALLALGGLMVAAGRRRGI